MGEHVRMGGSGAGRLIACPGSVRLSEGIERPHSHYATEGTEAHELAEKILLHQEPEKAKEHPAYNDIMVYVDFIQSLKGERYIEVPVTLEAIQPPEEMKGTADCVIVDGDTLHVIDYKHGKGIPVEIEGNAQLRYYALAAVLTLNVQVSTLKMTIVQPRCHHKDGAIRSETISFLELVDFGLKLMEAAHEAVKSKKPRMNAGTHCRWCAAAGVCPVFAETANEVAQTTFTEVLPPPVDTLTNEQIGDVLDRLPVLEDWIKQVRAIASRKVESGEDVPGWKLVAKKGNRKWKNEDAVVEWAKSNGYDEDHLYDKKLKSVAQLEKVVGKKNLDVELFHSPSTGTTLVPFHDGRASCDVTTVFTAIDEQ